MATTPTIVPRTSIQYIAPMRTALRIAHPQTRCTPMMASTSDQSPKSSILPKRNRRGVFSAVRSENRPARLVGGAIETIGDRSTLLKVMIQAVTIPPKSNSGREA